MQREQMVAQIMRLDLLKPVPDESKEPLANLFISVGEHFTADAGEVVLREGHLGFASGYVMLDGEAEVVKDGHDAVPLRAPVLLGEMSQFHTKDTRSASVRTTTASSFLQFDWTELYEQAEKDVGSKQTRLLRAAIERLIWKRFNRNDLLKLPLFNGLGEELTYKACVMFPWMTERLQFKPGDNIFHKNTRCQSNGYLLVEGKARMNMADGREVPVAAPNILGVMPENDPKLRWSASCYAVDDVTLLVFSWQQYMTELEERLSAEDMKKVTDAFKTNAQAHFQH